jgi:flavin-dependent dehydrogenase
MRKYDLVIIGGGPAGSTVATLTKRYSPDLKILLLEKAHFPRHHVGESLLAGATPVLKEMGAYEQVNKHGFLEKLGATYVWGHDRKPWGFSFNELNTTFTAQGRRVSEIYTKAWQVNRAEYDHILLKQTEEVGVEVHQGARVTHLVEDQVSGRITSVEYADEHGLHTVECSWLVDCSGQDAFLGRKLNIREYDEKMNNYALWGYWQGLNWKSEYLGSTDLTRIFVVTTKHGWLWCIPLRPDVVSVGLVTHRQTLKDMKHGSDQLYLDEVASCAEIHGIIKDAHLIRMTADQTRDVCAIQDWSYTSKRVSGPSWALVGDSAGFVDPILSSGTMLTHELGQKAAYTLLSTFASSSDDQIQTYWDFYNDTYQTYLQAYRDMASFWYSNNFSMESWQWEARRILTQRDSTINLTDREAFTRIAFGYASRTESVGLFGSYAPFEALKLADGLFGSACDVKSMKEKYMTQPLQLKDTVQIKDGMYYYWGRIRNTKRIIGENKGYLDLHPSEERFVELLRDTCTLDDLNQAARNIQERKELVRSGMDLVVQLDNIGALV